MGLLTVLVDAGTDAPALTATLRSVVEQSARTPRVIVALPRESPETIIEAARRAGSAITTLAPPEAQSGSVWAALAAAAEGDYLAFLQPGDVWFPWTREAYASAIRECEQPALIFGRALLVARPAEATSAAMDRAECAAFPDALDALGSAGFEVRWSTMVVRREAFSSVASRCAAVGAMTGIDLAMRVADAPGAAVVRRPYTAATATHIVDSTATSVRQAAVGVHAMLDAERRGEYPGGAARAGARHRVLAGLAREVASRALQPGLLMPAVAAGLYFRTLAMRVRLAAAAMGISPPRPATHTVRR